jgi:hypothetical protein
LLHLQSHIPREYPRNAFTYDIRSWRSEDGTVTVTCAETRSLFDSSIE